MSLWDKHRRARALVIVISGPAGVGKDALLERFVAICPDAHRCVTMTTRDRREGERPGVDYHFVTRQEFIDLVEADGFLEHATVHGELYGTPKLPVLENLRKGVDTILKIDVQGGVAVKGQMPDAVMVFIAPPSLEELERRLRGRGSDSIDQINRRLMRAREELEYIAGYDYLIVNDDLTTAAEQLRSIVVAEHCRVQR